MPGLRPSSRALLPTLVVALASLWIGAAATAEAPALGGEVSLAGLVDLDGRPLPATATRGPTVLLFARSDCPISNRYAPEVQRLHAELAPRGVRFLLVYPDPAEPVPEIRAQHAAYGYPFAAVRDPEQAVTRATGATITPEAAVLDATGRLVYRGRIDDRWVDFGKQRPEPTTRDLETVLDDLVAGREVEPRSTRAIGCYIPGVEPTDLLHPGHHESGAGHSGHGP